VSEHAPSPAAGGQARPVARPQGPARFRFDAWFFLIAAAVFTLDQTTKLIVRATLDPHETWPNGHWFVNIINVSNSGAAFGILQGQTVFLIATSLVGVAAIVLYYLYPPMEHGLLRVALGLQLGGAAGNLIDRVRTGEVTDFINFRHWPAFNVADSCISVGVVTILWFFLVVEGDRLRSPPGQGESSTAD
jgi:signal peptidase II